MIGKIKDKEQKISSYKSWKNITVYETLQYNQKCKCWFIVSDSTTNDNYLIAKINKHNASL